eukprot:TRINITY_DN8279_c0_g2_i1.p1 TRINITY_DN8279_c0_g2~~TRINITY_DN8279_c0_g2_i1.p1  ORF type:complete len:731 (-),score=206.48 TRINITY_DN8279_c0_g2_i1:481-2550(-)
MSGIRSKTSGPYVKVKAEVGNLKPRIAAAQKTLTGLQSKLTNSKRLLADKQRLEESRKNQVVDRHVAEKMTAEADKVFKEVMEKVEKALPACEEYLLARGKEKGMEKEKEKEKAKTTEEQETEAEKTEEKDGAEKEKEAEKTEEKAESESDKLKVLVQNEAAIQEASQALREARMKLRSSAGLNETRRPIQAGPMFEARRHVSRLEATIGDQEVKCNRAFNSLQVIRKQMTSSARSSVAAALRDAAKKAELDAEALFDKLCKGNPTIKLEELQNFVGPDLKVELGLESHASTGLTKMAFLSTIQDYMKVVKEIAVTDVFDIKSSKTVRKLAMGEMVEVLEEAKIEESSGLPRIKCRTLTDNSEGWVSTKGTQGGFFLEKCAKPIYNCRDNVSLSSKFETGSPEVRQMFAGQVMEVREGPRREDPTECQRVRVKAQKDGATGWFTQDSSSYEATEVLVCRSSTAITTEFNIRASKSIRKSEVGEVMDILEEAKEDEQQTGLKRAKVKTRKDGKEGWVTLVGNQGTVYIEKSDKHHAAKKVIALEALFKSGSNRVRQLEEGELFEIVEEKTEKKEGDQRVCGRDLSDGTVGWFTFVGRYLTLWSPRYRCLKSADLTEDFAIPEGAEAKAVRKIAQGELVEALDVPKVDQAAGLIRIRVRAEKDNAIGWVTSRTTEGTISFEALAPVSGAER